MKPIDQMSQDELVALLNRVGEWNRLRAERNSPFSPNLLWAKLDGANLSRADLSRADLSRANLTGADLSRANLTGANLNRTNLTGADLSFASLSSANLFGTNLSGANLSGADLSRADLLRVRDWDEILNIKYANIFGVYNAPEGFREWALNHGAVQNPSQPENSPPGLSVMFDGDFTTEETATILSALSDLYRSVGGDGLVIQDQLEAKARVLIPAG